MSARKPTGPTPAEVALELAELIAAEVVVTSNRVREPAAEIAGTLYADAEWALVEALRALGEAPSPAAIGCLIDDVERLREQAKTLDVPEAVRGAIIERLDAVRDGLEEKRPGPP